MEIELKPFDFGKMVGALLAMRRVKCLLSVELPQDGQRLLPEHRPHIGSQSLRQQTLSFQ